MLGHGGCLGWLWKGLGWHQMGHFSPHLNQQPKKRSSNLVGSFQSGQVFTGQKALTVESSLLSGSGQCHEPALMDLWDF